MNCKKKRQENCKAIFTERAMPQFAGQIGSISRSVAPFALTKRGKRLLSELRDAWARSAIVGVDAIVGVVGFAGFAGSGLVWSGAGRVWPGCIAKYFQNFYTLRCKVLKNIYIFVT